MERVLNSMKKLCFYIFYLLMGLLTACEPMVFGIPQSQWNQLTLDQKNQVIAGYNERQAINAQNAPLQNAINTAGSLIQANQLNQNNTVVNPLPPNPPDFAPAPLPSAPPF